MFHGTASSSFKSDGFNPITIDSPSVQAGPRNAAFETEFVDAIEIGMKATLMDGAMRLNGTYFFYDYQDPQVSSLLTNQFLLDPQTYGLTVGYRF